jgi:spermidine synthase
MIRKRSFVLIYACSGLAGLIYQVTWTRLLTLYMGHTVAAVTTVVATFMGGLAVGALIGGRITKRLTRRKALYGYAAAEAIAALTAVALPFVLGSLEPIVSAAYADGAAPIVFPLTRVLLCVAVLLIPTAALGASFPLAISWYADASVHAGHGAGTLYAANTIGATLGAVAAGFVLLPALGNSGTLLVAIVTSIIAIAAALVLAYRPGDAGTHELLPPSTPKQRQQAGRRERAARQQPAPPMVTTWARSATSYVAPFVLLATGFSTLMYEIAWTRVLSLLAGPTTYSVAATLAMIIAGIAVGSTIGTLIAARTRIPHVWIGVTLAATALAIAWTTSFVGSSVPRLVAEQLARSASISPHLTTSNVLLMALLIVPAAVGVGVSFPLALSLAPTTERTAAARVGVLYAVNTVASVAGTLVAGYAAIPLLGVEGTLKLVSALLLATALVVTAVAVTPAWGRIATLAAAAGSLAILVGGPSWDRPLLASGVYKYAAFLRSHVDPEAALTAGDLLYYRDGAASTVSVKRLTGTLSLSIDGKVDASTGSDMLTQKLLAHLPLLLHPNPRQVLIIGLGSGVTAGAALTHPIDRADVVEISPEVV